MNLAERRWLRLFTLGLLFFAQGIPWGFMAITLLGYLAEHGATADTLANITTVTGTVVIPGTPIRFPRTR